MAQLFLRMVVVACISSVEQMIIAKSVCRSMPTACDTPNDCPLTRKTIKIQKLVRKTVRKSATVILRSRSNVNDLGVTQPDFQRLSKKLFFLEI